MGRKAYHVLHYALTASFTKSLFWEWHDAALQRATAVASGSNCFSFIKCWFLSPYFPPASLSSKHELKCQTGASKRKLMNRLASWVSYRVKEAVFKSLQPDFFHNKSEKQNSYLKPENKRRNNNLMRLFMRNDCCFWEGHIIVKFAVYDHQMFDQRDVWNVRGEEQNT